MEIIKYKKDEVLPHIKHDLRVVLPGKSFSNESIQTELFCRNYSLLNRDNTLKAVNSYRKEIENDCYKINRADVVHAVEVVIQCPSDCAEPELFFKTAHEFICSTLPMGESCVFLSEVHRDEFHYTPSGEMISKEHLHMMFTPAVPDTKHNDFNFKLSCKELVNKEYLKKLHPEFQNFLDERGIKATVFKKKSADGKQISLSSKQLKELTKLTGIVLDQALTVEHLAEIINKNIELEKEILKLTTDKNQNRWANYEKDTREKEMDRRW